jgi:hypothetical protein
LTVVKFIPVYYSNDWTKSSLQIAASDAVNLAAVLQEQERLGRRRGT